MVVLVVLRGWYIFQRGSTVSSYEMIIERVDNGIKELDHHVPGWRDKVNCAILDVYSLKDCVVGQVFGSYDAGDRVLDLDDTKARYYGFDAENPNDKEEYENLTNEWKRRIYGSHS